MSINPRTHPHLYREGQALSVYFANGQATTFVIDPVLDVVEDADGWIRIRHSDGTLEEFQRTHVAYTRAQKTMVRIPEVKSA